MFPLGIADQYAMQSFEQIVLPFHDNLKEREVQMEYEWELYFKKQNN